MAIKIKGDTIIDDGRVLVNADKIGIGTTNPQVALEIFSGDVGIGTTNPSASNIKTSLESNTNILAVGIVTANEYFGTFKGSIDPDVIAEKANKANTIQITDDTTGSGTHYIHFGSATSGYDDVEVDSTGLVYKDGSVGIGTDNPNHELTVYGDEPNFRMTHTGSTNKLNSFYATVDGAGVKFNSYQEVTATKRPFIFKQYTTERLRITADGHVGIGTTLPEVAVVAGNNKILAVGIVTANELYGEFKGTINPGVGLAANTVKTVTSTSNSPHYLTFVDSDNATATSESVYTDGGITYQPNLDRLGIGTIKPEQILNSSNNSGTANYVIQADGSGGWDWGLVEPGNIGTLDFTDLDDTPANYTSAGGKLVRVNSGATGLEFITASDAGKTYTLEGVASGNDVKLRLSDGSTDDDVLITKGTGITFGSVTADGFTISANSDAGKTYTLEGVESGDNVKLRLSDGSTDDDVLITKGTGITFSSVTADGFTISASGSGTGTLTDLDVKQFSSHGSTPRAVRSCSNPIDVTVDSTAGIATIGIGSTSNAYGKRYIQDTVPSTDVCEGDIWFDTSTTTSSTESDKVAILRDEKTSGTEGGQYSAGVWHTRTLNVEYDSFNFVSLSSNVFSMAAGDYKINWSAPALHVDNFQTRIAYTTDSTFSSGINYYYGSSAYSGETGSGGGNYSDSVDQSFGEYLSSTTATTYYRIEQKISTSESTSDFGAAASMGLEVYLQVAIEDLSTAVKEGGVGIGSTTKIQQDDTKAEVIDTGSNGHFLVETDGTERLRIIANGNVGIGSINPSTKLDVLGNIKLSDTNPEIQLNTGGPRFRVPAANTLAIHKGGDLGSTNDEVLRITSDGNVGIGTTIPDDPIGIQSSKTLAVAGIVTAFKYYGDGSQLTGISGGGGAVVGSVIGYAGAVSNVPSGYVLCDGRVLSRTTYSDLFAILGTIHNTGGEASNVFRIPDLRDKFIVGAYSDGSDTTYPQVKPSATGGDANGSLPSHYHNFPGDDQLAFANNTTGGEQNGVTPTWASTSDDTFQYDATSTNSGGGRLWRTTTVGSSTLNSNLPPYYALAYIIKTNETATLSAEVGSTRVAVVKDQKNTNVDSGNFQQDGWRDRDLTVKDDPFNFVTLYTNASYQTTPGTGGRASYFSLPAGKYKIKFRAPAYRVDQHMAAIGWSPNESDINKTYATGDFNSGGEIYGSSEYTGSNSGYTTSDSEGAGVVEITQISYFKVIHYCKDTKATSGFGIPSNIGSPDPETYTIVEIEDLATAVKDGADSFVLLTEKTATGTSVEFTGIPSDAMEITLMFKGVSVDGNNHIKVQLGTSSGYVTSGYVSSSETSNGASQTSATDSFIIYNNANSFEHHGSMIINKASSNSYTQIGAFRRANSGGTDTHGSLSSISGTIDRLKIFVDSTGNGSDFDAGVMSVSYKTSGSGGGSGGGSGSGGVGTTKVAILKDQKDNQVNGGNFIKDAWRDRDLTVEEDPSTFVDFTVGGSQSSASGGTTPGYWSLPSGDYKIDWSATGYDVNRHKTRLVYSTTQSHISTAGLNASASFVEGSSENNSVSENQSTASTGHMIINLTQTTWFKVMHYCSNTNSNGFGRIQGASDTGSNIYSQVRIEDLTTAVKSGIVDKIEEGNTSAEVVDTGSNGHFLVKTEGTERLRITDSGTLEIRKNEPQIQLIDTDDSTGNTKTQLIHNAGDLFVDLRDGANDGELIIRGKGGDTATEKLRIKGDTDTTFANSDDFVLMGGGGTPVPSNASPVTGVINMGTSYYTDGTGNDARNGSGDWKALKLQIYKATTGTNAQTIDNVYGLGLSNGVMEIQSNGDIGFFAGSAGAGTGKRTERLRITDAGNVNIGGGYKTENTYTLYVNGSLGVTGTKSFVIDHPTKDNHRLIHGCLEGPEHAVYVRGKTSGSVINLPDYWVSLVHEDSITVNLTPIGNKRVWVESINNNIVTIGSDDSTEYFYTIFGERKDVDKLVVEVEK